MFFKKKQNKKKRVEIELNRNSFEYSKFIKKLNSLADEKISFDGLESYVHKAMLNYPDKVAEINKAVFVVFKDMFPILVMPYGDKYLQSFPDDDRFKKIFISRKAKAVSIKQNNKISIEPSERNTNKKSGSWISLSKENYI
ncbi:hypothetical protein AB9G26_08890, partial [Francisella philomiragia]|uniref:hypothetical protein n=1 Tax=Francisella philomiragia TaxID=28110 RepID=UPI003512E69D